jgi:hypothetical protein
VKKTSKALSASERWLSKEMAIIERSNSSDATDASRFQTQIKLAQVMAYVQVEEDDVSTSSWTVRCMLIIRCLALRGGT